MPHVDQTTDEGVQADARAAIEHLRGLGVRSVFSVGFCFGGRASWVAAASGHGLAGAIGFYGSPTRQRGGPSVVAACGGDRMPDPRAAGGRRRRHHGRRQRRVRAGARGRRRRARDRHVRRCAAQLLRPQAGGSSPTRRTTPGGERSRSSSTHDLSVILAIDQGTTGTTCLVVDDELHVLRRGYAELPQHFPRPGWVEHDPEEIWQSVLGARRTPAGLDDGRHRRDHQPARDDAALGSRDR